jgi:uncharacterized glyoxalase superfamily protein PhnB
VAAKSIPEGVSVVTPYLCVANATKALEFYEHVFGAKETMRFAEPGRAASATPNSSSAAAPNAFG